MERLFNTGHECFRMAEVMASLCRQLLESKELSGDGWEGLFVLFLLARSIAGKSDGYFLPDKEWLTGSFADLEVKYNPYCGKTRSLGDCKNWEQL
jgi:hypothetical protein